MCLRVEGKEPVAREKLKLQEKVVINRAQSQNVGRGTFIGRKCVFAKGRTPPSYSERRKERVMVDV